MIKKVKTDEIKNITFTNSQFDFDLLVVFLHRFKPIKLQVFKMDYRKSVKEKISGFVPSIEESEEYVCMNFESIVADRFPLNRAIE